MVTDSAGETNFSMPEPGVLIVTFNEPVTEETLAIDLREKPGVFVEPISGEGDEISKFESNSGGFFQRTKYWLGNGSYKAAVFEIYTTSDTGKKKMLCDITVPNEWFNIYEYDIRQDEENGEYRVEITGNRSKE